MAARALALLALGCCLGAALASERLVMQEIGLQPLRAVPPAGPQPLEPHRFSGYFKLNRTYEANMFFFYFEAREAPETAPVVLWMTGGPGCSSELAVFYENGPWTITKDLQLNETQYGWDVSHHMIFVDQPINTGFSWSDDDRDRCYDEACVANDMLDFLTEFFAAVPELRSHDFFVTGESFAGHYVPAVASRVFLANRAGELLHPINLKGLAIGNGLTVPRVQYGAYADYALRNGLISEGTRQRVMMLYPACRLALDVCQGLEWRWECIAAVEFCQATMFAPIMMENPEMNVYDIRKKCVGPLCYDFSRMEEYLNLPEVRKALGVGDREWQACSPSVHQEMMGDWGLRYDTVLPDMLDAGVTVMIYAGNQDFICNWLGNRRWVDQLNWHGSDAWVRAEEREWVVDGEAAGKVTQAGPLAFVKVYDAGHMVPMDKPRNALQMITAFTRNEPLVPPSSTAVASGTTTPAPDATGSASGSAGAPKRAQRAETLLGATWTIRQGRKEGPGEGAQEVLAQK